MPARGEKLSSSESLKPNDDSAPRRKASSFLAEWSNRTGLQTFNLDSAGSNPVSVTICPCRSVA